MKISYDDKSDLLYIRLDEKTQDIVNKRVSDDVVLDIGANEKIIGIEILNASLQLNLGSILPIQFERLNATV
jgi:uncharacterized protein YuzE